MTPVDIHKQTIDEIIADNNKTCPLSISIIPNTMGINLVSVDSIEWEKKGQQLIFLKINFIPN